jgi:hypothetical protein
MNFQHHLLVVFRSAYDWLSSGYRHLRSVFLSIVFLVLLASFVVFHLSLHLLFFNFSLYLHVLFFSPFFLFFFFFAYNKARSSLFDLPIYILKLCGIFALGPDLLGCGCERYLGFQVEEDEFQLEGFLLSRPINNCYLCI